MDERQQPLAGSDEKGAFGRVPGRGVKSLYCRRSLHRQVVRVLLLLISMIYYNVLGAGARGFSGW